MQRVQKQKIVSECRLGGASVRYGKEPSDWRDERRPHAHTQLTCYYGDTAMRAVYRDVTALLAYDSRNFRIRQIRTDFTPICYLTVYRIYRNVDRRASSFFQSGKDFVIQRKAACTESSI